MADNEKLLEAARMIREHCKHTEMGAPCPFAFGGVCDCAESCGISNGECVPDEDWHIPKPCRWTENDALMAKALISVGYTSVCLLEHYSSVLASDGSGLDWRIPSGLFSGVKTGETINLSDIIAEYEAR